MAVPRAVLEEVLQRFRDNPTYREAFHESRKTVKEKRVAKTPNERSVARHRAFFVWRRADLLGTLNPSWVAASPYTTLIGRIVSEYDAVTSYLRARLGTRLLPGPLLPVLGGSGDPVLPNHLDLRDLAWQRTVEDQNASVVRRRGKEFTFLRFWRVHWIVWRAAAIHHEVWEPAPDQRTATLRQPVINEYLDRRLRVLERMHFNIGMTEGEVRTGREAIHGAMGPRRWNFSVAGEWRDSFRVRIFEYPRVSPVLLSQIGAANVGDENTAGLLGPSHDAPGHAPHAGDPHWMWSETRRRLEWRVRPTPQAGYAWRLPPPMRSHWTTRAGDSYRANLKPAAAATGDQVVDQLFSTRPERLDLWSRAWFWCDWVICSCSMEALLFGLRRRLGTAGGNGAFNDLTSGTGLPAGGSKPYVTVQPMVGDLTGANMAVLQAHGNDRHFQNRLIDERDLQTGDHLIFWNHVLYALISTGDWRLENAYVMHVGSTSDGGIARTSIALQGHGTEIRTYTRYQQLIAEKLGEAMEAAREKIRREVAANAAADHIPWRSTHLRRWSPYGNFQRVQYPAHGVLDLGAWWVEIPLAGTSWSTAAAAVAALPKTVAQGVGGLGSPGAGYNPMPAAMNPSSSVYFPIFEPRTSLGSLQGWGAFFERRLRPNPPGPILMDVVRMTGSLIPGLYKTGLRSFPIVRPKATP